MAPDILVIVRVFQSDSREAKSLILVHTVRSTRRASQPYPYAYLMRRIAWLRRCCRMKSTDGPSRRQGTQSEQRSRKDTRCPSRKIFLPSPTLPSFSQPPSHYSLHSFGEFAFTEYAGTNQSSRAHCPLNYRHLKVKVHFHPHPGPPISTINERHLLLRTSPGEFAVADAVHPFPFNRQDAPVYLYRAVRTVRRAFLVLLRHVTARSTINSRSE